MPGREFRRETRPVMASTQAWCGTGGAHVVMPAAPRLAARRSATTSTMVTGTQMRRSINDGPEVQGPGGLGQPAGGDDGTGGHTHDGDHRRPVEPVAEGGQRPGCGLRVRSHRPVLLLWVAWPIVGARYGAGPVVRPPVS
jgi:hypothetical protein